MDGAFWAFSLRLYGRDGVPAACLAIQECAGVDVNVMLFALHLADRGRQLTDSDMMAIDAHVRDWREQVVKPLRALRSRMKGGVAPFPIGEVESLRNEVKRIELHAERAQQFELERRFTPVATGTPAVDREYAGCANLDACERLGPAWPVEARATLLANFAALAAPLETRQ